MLVESLVLGGYKGLEYAGGYFVIGSIDAVLAIRPCAKQFAVI